MKAEKIVPSPISQSKKGDDNRHNHKSRIKKEQTLPNSFFAFIAKSVTSP